jgi:hypothetical protein
MTVFEVESYFETPEKMQELLAILQEKYFSKIAENGEVFLNGSISEDFQLKKTLEELTGVFLELNPIYYIVESIKKRREGGFYVSKKIEIENNGEKFVATSTDKEASHFVAEERRVRNTIFGNVLACTQGISTCQSKLKHVGKEIELSK